jgi:hypothetical protein
MHKLIFTFAIIFIGCSFLSAIPQGGGGWTSATLTSSINSTSTFIPFNTESFGDEDILTIDGENILYISKNATGVVTQATYRGYSGTTATDHTVGATVYTEETGILNEALGFNIALQIQTGGILAIIQLPIQFITTTLPHLIWLNLSIISIPELAIIGVLWFGFGMALLVVLAIQLGPLAISLAYGLAGLLGRGLAWAGGLFT